MSMHQVCCLILVARNEPNRKYIDLFYVDLDPVYVQRWADETPAYDRSVDSVIGLSSPKEEDSRPAPVLRTCWNCGSTEHQLSSCPEPRNRVAINDARLAFQAAKDSGGGARRGNGPPMRLHEAEAVENRYLKYVDRFEAGKISAELREAIGYSSESTNFPWLKVSILSFQTKVRSCGCRKC